MSLLTSVRSVLSAHRHFSLEKMESHWSVGSFEKNRQYGHFQSSVLPCNFKDSLYLMQRLKLVSSLKHHSGCVNTIAWNEGGRTLISGSDDCHLVVTDPFHKRVLCSVPTEHHSNIFCARFLPLSCDYRLVSCAGNGTVQYTEVDPTGSYLGHMFNCHTSITYQVATSPVDRHEFLSCEEKGLVRLFDLRAKNKCNCSGCDVDVVYSSAHAVTCLGVNPRMPYYLAMGVSDGTVRVVDRRMMSPRQPRSIVQYKPPSLNHLSRLTAVQFDSSGSEILASYSEEHIYLFNFQDPFTSPLVHCRSKRRQMEACFSGCHSRRRRVAGTRKGVNCSASAVPKAPVSPVADSVHPDGREKGSGSSRGMPQMKRLRLRGDWSDTGPDANPDDVRSSTVNGVMQHMSAILASWMEGTLASQEEDSDENSPVPEQRDDTAVTPASSSSVSSLHSTPSPHTSSIHTHSTQEGSTPGLQLAASTCQTPPPSPGALSSSFAASCCTTSSKKQSHTPRDEGDTLESATTALSSPDKDPHLKIEVEPGSDPESSVADHGSTSSPAAGIPQSATTHSAVGCEENVCTSPVRGATRTEPSDPLRPFMCYKGHRNTRTMIKQANLWGDDYVMSGSDCGRVFVWDKWTGHIVNVMVGDKRVVNCVQPHPEAFMLATSGIDYDIKLWEPCATEPCRLDDLQEIVERNERMLKESRNTVTVPSVFVLRFLSYLSRRRRLQGGDQAAEADVEDDEEDSEGDNDQ